jgi:hypothetical protein
LFLSLIISCTLSLFIQTLSIQFQTDALTLCMCCQLSYLGV